MITLLLESENIKRAHTDGPRRDVSPITGVPKNPTPAREKLSRDPEGMKLPAQERVFPECADPQGVEREDSIDVALKRWYPASSPSCRDYKFERARKKRYTART